LRGPYELNLMFQGNGHYGGTGRDHEGGFHCMRILLKHVRISL
jgi:hypothetical protein